MLEDSLLVLLSLELCDQEKLLKSYTTMESQEIY